MPPKVAAGLKQFDLTKREKFNLEALKRKDPQIDSIIYTFDHVVLYEFQNDEWVHSDYEGAMHILNRKTAPHYSFLIVNRKTPENFSQAVDPTLQVQDEPPYIMFKNDVTQKIYGLYFHNYVQALTFASKINEIIEKLKSSSPSVSSVQQQQQQQQQLPMQEDPNFYAHHPHAHHFHRPIQPEDKNQVENFLKSALNIAFAGGANNSTATASSEDTTLLQQTAPVLPRTAMSANQFFAAAAAYEQAKPPVQPEPIVVAAQTNAPVSFDENQELLEFVKRNNIPFTFASSPPLKQQDGAIEEQVPENVQKVERVLFPTTATIGAEGKEKQSPNQKKAPQNKKKALITPRDIIAGLTQTATPEQLSHIPSKEELAHFVVDQLYTPNSPFLDALYKQFLVRHNLK